VLGAALLIVAIGLSRLYLGVRSFSDVVGGYAQGCCGCRRVSLASKSRACGAPGRRRLPLPGRQPDAALGTLPVRLIA